MDLIFPPSLIENREWQRLGLSAVEPNPRCRLVTHHRLLSLPGGASIRDCVSAMPERGQHWLPQRSSLGWLS
jgi:hypothetical protein